MRAGRIRGSRLIGSIALVAATAQAGPSDERLYVTGTESVVELSPGDFSLLGEIDISGASAVRSARDGSTWILEGDTIWRFEPDGTAAFALPLGVAVPTHVALAVDAGGDAVVGLNLEAFRVTASGTNPWTVSLDFRLIRA